MTELYSINKLMQDKLLYLHFDAKNGYFFKVSMLGACGFKYENAQNMLETVFNNEPTITLMKMNITEDCVRLKVTSADLKNLQFKTSRTQKRKQQRKRAKDRELLTNAQQGPAEVDEEEDQPVPPTTF